MEYTQRLVVGVLLVVSSIQANQVTFNSFGTVNSDDVANIVIKYGQKNGVKSGNLNAIMQERALLLEAFFVHCGLLFSTQVVPGDTTNTQKINIGSLLQSALPPEATALNVIYQLPETCGLFYNLARYMRGFGQSIGTNVTTVATRAIDSFYGVIVINNGWYGAYTQPQNFEDEGGVVKNNIYWVKSGITFNDNSLEQTFIKQGAIGIAKASGVFNGANANNQRVMSFKFTDKDGSINFTSDTALNQITLTQNSNQSMPTVMVGNTPISMKPVQSILKSSIALPWALVVEVINVPTATGGYTLEPVLKVRGIVRLNPSDFPLSYQMPAASFITQPFNASFLMQGFSFFKQLIESTAQMTSNVSWYGSFGNCNNEIVSLTMSSTDIHGMYFQPLNIALAKYYGALEYQWGTNYTMEAALNGSNSAIQSLFLKQSQLTLPSTQEIDPLVSIGMTILKDPSFTAL